MKNPIIVLRWVFQVTDVSICWFQTNFQNIFKIRWHPTQWWNFCPFLNIGALIAEIWKWTYKFKASTIAIICLDPKHSYKIPKISQLPCPSARKKKLSRTNQICPWQNHFCPGQNFLSEVKKSWLFLLQDKRIVLTS